MDEGSAVAWGVDAYYYCDTVKPIHVYIVELCKFTKSFYIWFSVLVKHFCNTTV